MMLFHSSCPRWDKDSGPVPRLRLVAQNEAICARTYRCDRCNDTVHVDIDWSEGVVPEKDARLD